MHALAPRMFCAPIGVAILSMLACGNDTTPPVLLVEQTGSSCTAPANCYPTLDAAMLMGQVTCLTPPATGYCTHTCNVDTDCCAVSGECNGYPQVCSPYQSTPDKYCFLSCEQVDLADAGVADANAFCTKYAALGMACRSTGGGSQNRKVCMP
jgi:hypothetical protein